MSPPAPNKIHNLPVVVTYHIPSSSETFSTILSAPQQVYVHPPSSAADDEEIWGSIYLKTVIQGVLMSSPEHIPSPTSDLSIYTRDPRESYLRKSRDRNFASSSGDVWTGKGLCSWALDEAGQGKNLITGRVVSSSQFALPAADLSPLEALAASFSAVEENNWGIEVWISLRDGTSVIPRGPIPESRPIPSGSRSVSNTPSTHHAHPHSSKTPSTKVPTLKLKSTSGKKKKASATSASIRERLGPIDNNRNGRPPLRSRKSSSSATVAESSCSQASGSGSSSAEETFPTDIPAALYTKPDSLTKEQAQRLLASPAFLTMLERVTGAPLEQAKRKVEEGTNAAAKRSRTDGKKEPEEIELKCYNCGRTKSAVWRSKVMEDGTSVRVCNACGLYWNKLRVMRPPTLWQAVDEENKERKKKPLVPPAHTPLADTSSPAPAAAPNSDPSGFKRTLTTFVNRDAQRLASLKKQPKSALSQAMKPAPATSPLRPLRTAAARVKFEAPAAASSPGFAPETDAAPQSDIFEVVKQEPNPSPLPVPSSTAVATSSAAPVQSLQMPLSDDEPQSSFAPVATSETQWDDFSAFFDVDAFALEQDVAPLKTHGRSPTPETTDFHRALSSGSRRKREAKRADGPGMSTDAADDDDVLSQLFHRTSSMAMMPSSPTRFDFSTLPPSSPPMLPDFSALLSSPDYSPLGNTPLDAPSVGKLGERRESGLQTSFTPSEAAALNSETQIDFDLEEMERILREHGTDLNALFDAANSDFGSLLSGV